MSLLTLTRRVVLFALLAPALAGAQQQDGTPSPLPPPRGKVLFERHEPAVPEEAPSTSSGTPAQTTVPQQESTEGQGVSSSQRRARTTLHRRVPPSTKVSGSDAETLPSTTAPHLSAGVSSSTVDSNDPATESLLTLTADDLPSGPGITAAERAAVLITASDLDLHLNNHSGDAEARARLTVQNTGSEPLSMVPLRLSGALHWESVRVADAATPLPLRQHHVADDLDHTGFATELAVGLPQPLAPGSSLTLDLYYGGRFAAGAQRLLAIGAPAGRAALTDWDTVTDRFTGLRGLGDVLWYPVADPPALLREGAAVIHAVETNRSRNAASRFHLRLTVQYAGSRPDAAFFCGERQVLHSLAGDPSAPDPEGGIEIAEWTRSALGPHTPSLFIASGVPAEVADGMLRVVTDRPDTAAALGEAAARIRPMLSEWLGASPGRPLDVLDLPIPGATGFVDGSLLVAPLTTSPASLLAPSMVQPLVTAWLPPDIAASWLRDGLPAFLQAVWAERTEGRSAALTGLAANLSALNAQADATPASQISTSQPVDTSAGSRIPLATCSDPACARGKSAYVFEMLRDMLGDAALQQAISGWRVQEEQTPHRTAVEETSGMEQLLTRVAGKRDLQWFFGNWIDADHGLPDLAIVTVAPRRVERSTPVTSLPEARKVYGGPIGSEPVAPTDPRDMGDRAAAEAAASRSSGLAPVPGSWLVAVEVQNNGSADAEVPVTVRAGSLTNTLQLRVAAHSRATIRVPFEADPQEILVNDGSVPEVRATQHRRTIDRDPVR